MQYYKIQGIKSKDNTDENVPPFWPHSGLSEDRDTITEILKNSLYLTNFRGAKNLEKLLELKIDCVVNINGDEKYHPKYFDYFCIDNVTDDED